MQYLSSTAEYVSIVNGEKEYTNDYVFTKTPTTKQIIAKAYYADNTIIERTVESAKIAFINSGAVNAICTNIKNLVRTFFKDVIIL